jgi:AbrB family looped-hinge helix DNA binding protein
MITKVGTRGQVSIPKEIRKRFGIESESRVEWFVEGKVIRVLPIPKDPVKRFRGKGNRTYTTEDLIKDRKDERALEEADDGKR